MRFLKFTLYLVLAVFLAWSSLVVFGPSIVSRLVYTHYGESIKLGRVIISPKLDIKIASIEFDGARFGSVFPLYGSARAIDIDWTYFTLNPSLDFSVGVSELKQVGSLESISINVIPKGHFDLSSLQINAEVKNLSLLDRLETEKFYTSASYEFSNNSFKEVTFTFSALRSYKDLNFHVEGVVGNIDNWNLSSPLSGQNNTFKADLNNFTWVDEEILISSISTAFKNVEGVLEGAGSAESIKTEHQAFVLDTLNFSGVASIKEVLHSLDLRYDFNLLSVPDLDLIVPKVSGAVSFMDNQLLLKGDVNVLAAKISIGSAHLAKLEDFIITFDLIFKNFYSEPSTQLALRVNSKEDPEVFGAAVFKSDFKEFRHIWACSFYECETIEAEINANISVNGQVMSFDWACQGGKCLSQGGGKLSTKNTKSFMSQLAEKKLINPVIVLSLYSQLLSGAPSGEGHVVRLGE